MKMKLAACGILNLIFVSSLFAQGLKVGIVDFQKIFNDSIRGKEAKALLEKEASKKKEIIESKKQELQKLIDEFDKQKLFLSKDLLQEKQKNIEEKSGILRDMVVQFQQELQQKDAEITRSILNEVQGIVEMVAKKYNLNLVIEKNEAGVVYFDNVMDITDKVLTEYDQRVKSKK